MADEQRCETVHEAIAELALGIASGDDRARVLEHAAECASCRRLLGELTVVGEELLPLVPPHEPPPGFEVRVLGRLGRPGRPRSRPRLRLALVAAAAAVAAAAVTAGGVLLATRDERRLGSQLGTVLERANGFYIGVTELHAADGPEVGQVFHYGGRPSWVLAILDRPPPADRYRVTLQTRAGATIDLGRFALGPDVRSFATTVAADLREVVRFRLHGERRGANYVARFP